MSTAEDSLKLAALYEAELLVELMLRHWGHPNCADDEYRNSLLESAVEVLRNAAEGTQFVDDVPAESMNLVAAIWYVEWNALNTDADSQLSVRKQRQHWVDTVRRSIPGCFCDPEDLDRLD